MARYDDLNTTMIGFSAIFSTFLLALIILSVQALCYSWQNEEDERKMKSTEYSSSLAVQHEQLKSLSIYGLIDVPAIEPVSKDLPGTPATKRIQIPIDRAIEMVIKESGGKTTDKSSQALPSGT